jgi:transcriptional regulator with XRE-family HTH domain
MSASPRPSQILLVGQKIRQIRKSRRWTQSDLAGRIGVTQSDLSRMENGEYKVGLDTLFRILQVFELSMSHFFEEPAEVPEIVRESSPQGSEEDLLLADWSELAVEARHEVREFIAFKRVQQESRESRQPRWKADDDGHEGGGA